MFWKKKKKKISASERPSVSDTEDFVEWLLRYGKDFEIFRTSSQSTLTRFVRVQSENILQEFAANGDEESLTASIIAGCADYASNYQRLVDTAGGMRNLPSHVHTKAFPLLVKLRGLMYLLHHTYGTQLTEPMLAVCDPLDEI